MTPREFRVLVGRAKRSHKLHYQSPERPNSVGRLLHTLWPSVQRPVFIVGAPRSGTTFLGSCFSGLEEFSYLFEPVLTKRLHNRVLHRPEPWHKYAYKLNYHALMARSLDADLRLVEKTPRNVLIAKQLADWFPDAVFLHCLRDGHDVALSLSEKPWFKSNSTTNRTEPGGFSYGPFPRAWVEPERRELFRSTSTIHRCIWSWRAHVEAGLVAQNTLPSHRWLTVRYEHLVASPAKTAQRIWSFVGAKSNSSPFIERVSQVHANSVGRYKTVLTAAQLQEIEQEAGPLLHRLGYSSS